MLRAFSRSHSEQPNVILRLFLLYLQSWNLVSMARSSAKKTPTQMADVRNPSAAMSRHRTSLIEIYLPRR